MVCLVTVSASLIGEPNHPWPSCAESAIRAEVFQPFETTITMNRRESQSN
jgi:hypothetical protein